METVPFADLEVSTTETPERNLLAAIMVTVIHDLASHSKDTRELALEFIESKSKKPFSFFFLCQHLDFDVSIVKQELITHHEKVKQIGKCYHLRVKKRRFAF